MIAPPEDAADEAPRPQVTVPPFCERHRRILIVQELGLGPQDPWMSREVVAQLLLFQHAAGDPTVLRRAEHDARNLSLVLAELGCLACWRPAYFRKTVRVMKKGFEYAARVSKNEQADPDSPFQPPATLDDPPLA